jgi:cell division septation protein DedD
MSRQVVSRTQRRMEKRQALILLVLILGVSLVSFTLGVMVGRSGANNPGVTAVSPASPRLPVAAKEEGAEPPAAVPAAERPAEKLTFYDTLPKGEQPPLGSGINLPPRKESPKTELAASPEPVRTAEAAPAVRKVSRPEPAPQGAYLVQAASFRGPDDAAKLRERLAGKAYAAFIEETDLKEKGVWHRVYIGPFATAEAAGRVVEKLQAEEKIAALVKKR